MKLLSYLASSPKWLFDFFVCVLGYLIIFVIVTEMGLVKDYSNQNAYELKVFSDEDIVKFCGGP